MLIVGEKELETNSVSVRKHGGEELGIMKVEDFIAHFQKAVKEELAQ